MANPDRSGPPIKSPSATALVQGLNRAIPTAWAVDVYDPGFVLIASPGNGLRRMTHGQFTRGMRHWRNCVEARRIGRLIDVHYLRYDRGERTATMARDCINRPYLTIGPVRQGCGGVSSDSGVRRTLDPPRVQRSCGVQLVAHRGLSPLGHMLHRCAVHRGERGNVVRRSIGIFAISEKTVHVAR